MNFQETFELIQALKQAGATHFKSSDFEVTLGPVSSSQPQAPVLSKPEQTKESEAAAAAKIKELINTMAMSPEQLADQIFPDGAL